MEKLKEKKYTLYNIRNEFFKKISVLQQFHNKSAQHHEKN